MDELEPMDFDEVFGNKPKTPTKLDEMKKAEKNIVIMNDFMTIPAKPVDEDNK